MRTGWGQLKSSNFKFAFSNEKEKTLLPGTLSRNVGVKRKPADMDAGITACAPLQKIKNCVLCGVQELKGDQLCKRSGPSLWPLMHPTPPSRGTSCMALGTTFLFNKPGNKIRARPTQSICHILKKLPNKAKQIRSSFPKAAVSHKTTDNNLPPTFGLFHDPSLREETSVPRVH